MRTDLFDFVLPPDRIALRPASPRDAARLLVVRPGGAAELADKTVRDLPDLLRPGDQLVVNDTKVIPASLTGRRIGRGAGARIEANLVERIDGARWRALVKGAKKLVAGDIVRFGGEGKDSNLARLDATVEDKGEAGEVVLAFACNGTALDQAIDQSGAMPLPPYIAARRPPDMRDRGDYQTLFARAEGAVAAPTAGLHFTDGLLARLRTRGIGLQSVTLHIGPGTFLPVKAQDTADHRMHAEWGEVSAATAAALNAARNAGGRIIAVGSTPLRLIETAAGEGGERGEGRERGESGQIKPFAGTTAIFITPGHRFRAADMLMTNFHLPRSTLFMLVAAFSGLDVMQRAYAHAIASGYRFYSYGDACLLFRQS